MLRCCVGIQNTIKTFIHQLSVMNWVIPVHSLSIEDVTSLFLFCCENLLICQLFSSTTCWLMILWRWWWAYMHVWEGLEGEKLRGFSATTKGRDWYPYDNRNGTNSIFWWWMVSDSSSSSSHFYMILTWTCDRLLIDCTHNPH